jgi:hypothetical protein
MYWTGTDVQRLQRSFGLRENEQTRSGRTLPFGDEPERNLIFYPRRSMCGA